MILQWISWISQVLCQILAYVFRTRLSDTEICCRYFFRPTTSSFILHFFSFRTADQAKLDKLSGNTLGIMLYSILCLSNCVVFGIFSRFSERNGNKHVFRDRLLVKNWLKIQYKTGSKQSYLLCVGTALVSQKLPYYHYHYN